MCKRSMLLPLAIFVTACATHHERETSEVTTFATPDEAMAALLDSSDDPAHADALLGPGGADALCACDAEESEDLALVREKLKEKTAFLDDGPDRKRVVLGVEEWELPIGLVRVGDRWRFDLGASDKEAVYQLVGENELRAIATMRELVDAQREYFAAPRKDGPPAYAARWCSTPGRHDGLYWEASDREPPSPIGAAFCVLEESGTREHTSEPALSAPVFGYRYRILDAERSHARDGTDRSFKDEAGRLTKGFAFIAWPIEYCVTGVMTFVVSDAGVVFQKDLGENTASEASSTRTFAPDASWTPVRDSELEAK